MRLDNFESTENFNVEYWLALQSRLENSTPTVVLKRSPEKHYRHIALAGNPGFEIHVTLNRLGKWIRAGIIIEGRAAAENYEFLREQKDLIESKLANFMHHKKVELCWEPKPDRTRSQINFYKSNVDPMRIEDWEEQHLWLCDAIKNLGITFGGYGRLR